MLLRARLTIIVIIGFMFIILVNGQQDCLQPYCTCLNATSLFCNNFTRYSQLDFRRLNGYLFNSVELRPLTMVDVNENLNFNGLKLSGRLTLCNIKSFNAFYNPFQHIFYDDKFSIAISNSYFKFVPSNNIHSPGQAELLEKCDYQKFALNYNYVFSNLVLTELTLNSVYFDRKICPILFRNTRMFSFVLNDAIGAFGFENVQSVPINIDLTKLLNVDIYQIEFNYNKNSIQQPQWLDAQNILYPFVFDNLDRVILNSALRFEYIQERTFEFLPSVRKLEINNMNIKDLLLRSRRWLKNLNFQRPSYDIENLNFDTTLAPYIFQLIIWVDNNEWNLDDERDICLFRNFPHNKLVFPFLLFSEPNNLKCTCTIYWLYKYFYKYQIIYNLNQLNVPFHCFQQAQWDRCQFDVLFNRYCPSNVDDPEESFTTLQPSTDYVIPTQTFPTQTSPFFTPSTTISTTKNPIITQSSSSSTFSSSSTSTFSSSTRSSSTFSSSSSTRSSSSSTRTSQTYTTTCASSTSTSSSAAIINYDNSQIPYAIIAFYLAIALSIVASFTTAAIIILCYKTLRTDKVSIHEKMAPPPSYIRPTPDTEVSNSDDTEYI